MTQLEKLEQEAFDNNVLVDYVEFNSNNLKGLYIDGSIALRRGMDSSSTADTLAEELEHHYTTSGNILDQNNIKNRKQERLARFKSYDRRIGLSGIIQGYRQKCQNQYELATCLGVSEETLLEAISLYREKYGCYTELDGYIIMFDPYLAVIETLT